MTSPKNEKSMNLSENIIEIGGIMGSMRTLKTGSKGLIRVAWLIRRK